MKISEFIEYLTQIQEEHGDLEVMKLCHPYDRNYDMYPVEEEDFKLHTTENGSPTMIYWIH